jgi:hypothetical protein
MFAKNEKLFYIDIKDGIIQEGKFIENNGNGVWIRLKGDSLNTYVYSDSIEERIFINQNEAQAGLEALRKRLKVRLLKDNSFIEDLLVRLKKSEGNLYASVIVEILHEKI